MRFGVVVFPGTWSDCDFHHVISEVLRQPVKYVWHRERSLGDLDCVVLPGGFSYGDYLRAGAVAGRSPVVEALRDFLYQKMRGARGDHDGDGLPDASPDGPKSAAPDDEALVLLRGIRDELRSLRQRNHHGTHGGHGE